MIEQNPKIFYFDILHSEVISFSSLTRYYYISNYDEFIKRKKELEKTFFCLNGYPIAI